MIKKYEEFLNESSRERMEVSTFKVGDVIRNKKEINMSEADFTKFAKSFLGRLSKFTNKDWWTSTDKVFSNEGTWFNRYNRNNGEVMLVIEEDLGDKYLIRKSWDDGMDGFRMRRNEVDKDNFNLRVSIMIESDMVEIQSIDDMNDVEKSKYFFSKKANDVNLDVESGKKITYVHHDKSSGSVNYYDVKWVEPVNSDSKTVRLSGSEHGKSLKDIVVKMDSENFIYEKKKINNV